MPTRIKALFKFIGSIGFTAGFAGLFVPGLVSGFLPGPLAALIMDNGILLLTLGAFLGTLSKIPGPGRFNVPDSTNPCAPDVDEQLLEGLDWSPLVGGGANFKTRKLVRSSNFQLKVRASGPMTLIALGMVAAGVGTPAAVVYFWGAPDSAAFFLAAPIFGGFGIYTLVKAGRDGVFDKRTGWYWKGRSHLNSPDDIRQQKDATRLSDILGVQLIAELVRDSGSGTQPSSTYYSYEINLVTRDRGRINVMDHGNPDAVAKDAHAIADFLNVPVLTPPQQGRVLADMDPVPPGP